MEPLLTDEFKTIQLGDKRLNDRAEVILKSLAGDAQASVNAACCGWSETQAAYRFFNNPKVRPEKILQPHRQAAGERIAAEPVVLLLQDSSELDFTAHPPAGAGPLTSEKRRGFLDHTQLAVTPERLCLGVLDAEFIARADEGFGEAKSRQYDPIETKETFRWLRGYRRACELQAQVPDTQIVNVADSEGDIYEIYTEIVQRRSRNEHAADFVIRAGKVRSTPELDDEASGRTYRKLQQEIQEAKVCVIREVELPQTPQRSARRAELEIRAQRIQLKSPHQKGHLSPVEVNVVLVREIAPPEDGTAVEWLLITSLPIETADDVLRVVDYYTARWTIEVYFRVFKTGCGVEEIQLETSERLLPCLMFYKIIAWRVLYLTHLGRECPDLPCDAVFAACEWKSVWRIVEDEPLPEKAPPLKTFLKLVGRLGGHNGRRHDGPPGPQSIWTGTRRMIDFALAWRAFGPKSED